MKTQTTFDDLVLEFPALDEKQGKELKGGGEYVRTYTWYPPYDGTTYFSIQPGGQIGNNTTGGSSDSSAGAWDTSSACYSCYSLDYSRLPPGNGTDTQVKNFCVFKTMEVANHYFGGQDNSGKYAQAYADTRLKPNMTMAEYLKIAGEGFNGSVTELYSLANQFFHTNNLGTNVEGVKDALAKNHPVMATIMINGVAGHEVLITQCDTNNSDNQNNRFIYFDPQEGIYKNGDASVFQFMIEVSGKK